MVFKFKGCPKCQGDLYLNRDSYGRYINCLQCGFTKDLVEPPAAPKPEPAAIGAQAEIDSPDVISLMEYRLAA